jgi:hypothetical protein
MNKKLLIGIGVIIILLAGLMIGWYLFSPLFIDNQVEEPLPSVEMGEEMSDGALTAVLSGTFTDADASHKGSGTATIYQQGEAQLLRFQDFNVTNGPDLHVLLSTSPNPTSQDGLGEYLDLGSLKGNVGDQNYDIPAGTDLSQYQSIVIYCQPFHVVFSTAVLTP